MAKASSSTEPSKPAHKRRTSDEMHKALSVLSTHRETLHKERDDEHVEVLSDVVQEVLILRGLLMRVSDTIARTQTDLATTMRTMGIS